MPVPGTKPQEVKRNHNPAVHEWTEVLDTPYSGPIPTLPDSVTLMSRGGNTYEMEIFDTVKQWWNAISHMPHCVLWNDTDWEFALGTVPVAQQAWLGNTGAAAELRMRETRMGATWDSRRDLRIKYVRELSASNEATAESNGQVVKPSSNDRRQRLTSVA
jgi:hypothetical protein